MREAAFESSELTDGLTHSGNSSQIIYYPLSTFRHPGLFLISNVNKVTVTERHTTGPPSDAPDELRCICVTNDDDRRRRQTPTIFTSLTPLPPYTMCRRASNKLLSYPDTA